VVNGDGTGDRLLTRAARPGVLAWEPGTHSLAYVTRAGNIAVRDVDRQTSPAYIRTSLSPHDLEWTPRGRLIAAGWHAVGVFARRGPLLSRTGIAGHVVVAAASPDGKRIAVLETRDGESTVDVDGKPVFKGAGAISSIAWSPDGRWLLLDWKGADQWLFIRSPVKKLLAVSNIRATFGAKTALAGWCCP
jgi:Tol biopolymer transport system component